MYFDLLSFWLGVGSALLGNFIGLMISWVWEI